MMDENKTGGRINHPDFMLIDLVTIIISFIISYLIKFGDFGFIHSEEWMPLLYIVSLVNIVICVFSDPYSGIFKRPYYEEIVRALLLTFYNLLTAGVIFYVFKIGSVFSRQMILTMFGIYFLLSLSAKCLWKKLVVSNRVKAGTFKKTSLFIVGTSENIDEVVHNAASEDFESYEFKGICLIDGTDTKQINGVPVIDCKTDFADFIIDNGIKEVLVAVKPESISRSIYEKLVSNGIGIHFSVDLLIGFNAEDHSVTNVGAYRTLDVGRYVFTPGQLFYFAVKRFLDIILGLLGIILIIPVALAVKLTYLASGDKSGIFYTQKRVGKDGKIINILKFRTMIPNADEVLNELLKDEKIKAEWEANQKLANDPRITRAGGFLRKTSLDELPQMLNVLKGDMSLVGPRPLVPGELESHGGMKLYQQVKPGITGWWGCNGRSNIDYRERLELEYHYVRNVSVYLDFLCVLRTVLTVLKRDGAQ